MAVSVPERILVTVRTYPNPSTRHREIVCAGGITEGGEWRRLYPVTLRDLDVERRFRTWDVIDVKVEPGKDGRPETRRPRLPTLTVTEHLDSWLSRYDWVQRTCFGSMDQLRVAGRSLGPVAVSSVKALKAVEDDAEWDPKRRAKLDQMMLFQKSLPLEKIPYRFRLVWTDGDGVEHDSLVISWEMSQTWRTYRRYDDPVAVMREKFLDDLFNVTRREVHFFMGNDSRRRNVFMVCGWFIPPVKEISGGSLFAKER